MDNDFKAIFGVWTQAIGTLTAALGNTPSLNLNETVQKNLSLIGNVMQATGDALLADSEEEISLGKIGNQIQAFGNSTVVIGILSNEQKTQNKLNTKGNLLQALGSAMSLPDLIDIENKSIQDILNIYAALLQTIGNSLQALSGKFGESEKGKTINFVGSWIQTTGAFIQAFAKNMNNEDSSSFSSYTKQKPSMPYQFHSSKKHEKCPSYKEGISDGHFS